MTHHTCKACYAVVFLLGVFCQLTRAKALLANQQQTAVQTSKKVDRLLEKLEDRLLEFQQQTQPDGQPVMPASSEERGRSDITAEAAASQAEIEFSARIRDFEDRLQRLRVEVAKHRATWLKESESFRDVEIRLRWQESEDSVLAKLDVTLDGYPLFVENTPSQLWQPKGHITVFKGLLPKGDYRLDIQAQWARKQSAAFPVSTAVFRSLLDTVELDLKNSQKEPSIILLTLQADPSRPSQPVTVSMQAKTSQHRSQNRSLSATPRISEAQGVKKRRE